MLINFAVKEAMGKFWRQLLSEVLHDLFKLVNGVYTGSRLKHWPVIFMLKTCILLVWEEIKFDANFRDPGSPCTNDLCGEMESIPVKVIVEMFKNISSKLPAFDEWDTNEHHQVLNSDPAACKVITEVRQHMATHGTSYVPHYPIPYLPY